MTVRPRRGPVWRRCRPSSGLATQAVAPRPSDVETLPGDSHEAAAVQAAVEALREAVYGADPGCRKAAAAAAWHAEVVVRLLCVTFGGGIAGVRVGEDGFIIIMAEFTGNVPVETRIAVGPEGTCACSVGAGDAQMASIAADARSFETVFAERVAQVGVHASVARNRR